MPSAVVSGRTALRRSLLVWGWGQLSAGDRSGWLGPPAQITAIGGLVVAAPHAGGVHAPAVFLYGAILAGVWLLVAAHAWRRAARRRTALGGEPGGGAADLLWLTPLLLAVGAGLWIAGGATAEPALALDAYLDDWSAGRVEDGRTRLVGPASLVAAELLDRWQRQDAALRNALARIVAETPGVDTDPAQPIKALRWRDLGSAPDGNRTFVAEAVREEEVADRLFGILPTTSRRLVTVERLGTAVLRPVRDLVASGPLGPVERWRIERVEIGGEVVLSGP